ncbi:MAG: NADH-quinone oxidoreductase subunit A [Bacillota bacterium]|jgi:NADH:ubiquinone oxidoreductase subunit 3 (chain A)|nr:NADH-quinone oxidoreductase subunit A [Bacillota bacterium]
MHPYAPLLIHVGVALLVPVLISVLFELISSRRADPVKFQPYESGYPTPPIHGRFPARFYLIAMLFVIFDVEAAAFVSWAVLLRELGTYGLGAMALFLIVFILGDLYVWKKGGFDWA